MENTRSFMVHRQLTTTTEAKLHPTHLITTCMFNVAYIYIPDIFFYFDFNFTILLLLNCNNNERRARWWQFIAVARAHKKRGLIDLLNRTKQNLRNNTKITQILTRLAARWTCSVAIGQTGVQIYSLFDESMVPRAVGRTRRNGRLMEGRRENKQFIEAWELGAEWKGN